MDNKKVTFIMYLLIAVGAVLVITGVGLLVFTDVYLDQGADGVLLIASLIAGGLFFLVPSKIYLTLLAMQHSSSKK